MLPQHSSIPASTVKLQNRVSEALKQTYEDLKAQLANESQVFMDESPTKQANQKAWLWTAVAATYAVFAIFATRAATALPKLLGNQFHGIINCDRAKMCWHVKRLQGCWAHLKRDIQSLIDHRDHFVRARIRNQLNCTKESRMTLNIGLEGSDTVTMNALSIWTIGHSTRTIEELIDILHHYQIEILVDVRHFPGSRRVPHFNKAALHDALIETGIRYEHLVELGGRRPARRDSHNVAWRNASFRSYADYMETQPFLDGVDHLLDIARTGRTAVMCSEAVWWRCHRSMIADYLKARGVQVWHILSLKVIQEHLYTSPARLVEGRLSYEGSVGS